jgi:exopolysaccharide biosynthesis polyprenyl glycosylphosphotransferase
MKNNASVIYSVCLILGDFIALLLAYSLAYILRVTIDHTPVSSAISSSHYFDTIVMLLPIFLIIFAFLGLYSFRIYEKRFNEFGRLFMGSFVAILLVISYGYVDNIKIFPARLVTLYGFLLSFIIVVVFRTIARSIRRQMFNYGHGISNVLIVGDTRLTHHLMNALADSSLTGYRVVGVVGGAKHVLDASLKHQLFESFDDAVHKLTVPLHTIIQTELYAAGPRNDEILVYAQQHHHDYRFVPGNSELFVGNLEVELFHSIPVIAVNQTPLTGWGRVVKRATDIIVSLVALVITSPVMLLTAILIKLTTGDHVLFSQTRLTRFDHRFKLYKFHSQYARYDGTTPEEAFKLMGKPELAVTYRENGDMLPNDPRITPIGRFIRRYSIDELPQLFNVLKGDISLVGPRSLIPEELALYQKRHAILAVKSGLTGLAQVSGRRDISFDERRTLDLFYVQNWSFWNDMVILIRTTWILLFHTGAE